MERYTRNSGGAIYGFDVTPAQVGPGRLDNRTPLAGLYLAGHWTRPGGGVAGVVRSGVRTAGLVLGVESDARAALHRPSARGFPPLPQWDTLRPGRRSRRRPDHE